MSVRSRVTRRTCPAYSKHSHCHAFAYHPGQYCVTLPQNYTFIVCRRAVEIVDNAKRFHQAGNIQTDFFFGVKSFQKDFFFTTFVILRSILNLMEIIMIVMICHNRATVTHCSSEKRCTGAFTPALPPASMSSPLNIIIIISMFTPCIVIKSFSL